MLKLLLAVVFGANFVLTVSAEAVRVKCNGTNEEWSNCPMGSCRPKSCSEVGYPVACPVQGPNGECPGKPGCICKEGYVKNNKGICVELKQCPSCAGDPNAVSGCGYCGRTCAAYYSEDPVFCTKECRVNACSCRANYVYDEEAKKCVLPKDCTCKANEVPDGCINGGCYSVRKCADITRLNGSTICVDPISCTKGCLCKPGYARDKTGKCIPEYKCPNSKCKKRDERYVQCASDCDVETCDQVGYGSLCGGSTSSSCTAKCVCRDELVRNSNGTCVSQDKCPTCGGDPNAKPGCGIYCGNRCSNYKKKDEIACIQLCYLNSCDCKDGYVYDDNLFKCVPPKECTPTCGPYEIFDPCANGGCYEARNCSDLDRNGNTIYVKVDKCIPGCLCKDGYLRDNKGKCRLENTCPNSKCKKGNETYIGCPTSAPGCLPETCADLGYQKPCPSPPPNQKCAAPAGCFCRNGYLRNSTGSCISSSDCPSCGGDKNAGPGCSNYCGNTCSGRNSTGPVACPLFCVQNGCACKPGFLYDDKAKKKKCVLPEKCTP